jgi:cation:H+ antiporter
MDMFIAILLLAVGIVLVVKGGDWFVDAATWFAKISGIPTFIIGATVVSIATTLPEQLVSYIGAAEGSVDLAIGNAVGSVNANVALIMGLSLVFLPSAIKRRDYFFKSALLILAVVAVWACSMTGELPLGLAFVVFAVFVIFLAENIYTSVKKGKKPLTLADTITVDDYNAVSYNKSVTLNADGTLSGKRQRVKTTPKEIVKNVLLFAFGTAALAGGSQLLVDNGTLLAELAGIPQSIIGVTIVAVGTSLPELMTTITAIRKKQSDLSVGNVIGANIIDLALIMPMCAFISGGTLTVNAQTLVLDLPFCIAACGFAVVPAMITGKFSRWQGAVMVAGYAAYITILVLSTMGVIHIF